MTPPHPPFVFSADCKAGQRDFDDFRAWRLASVPRYGIAYRCVAAASMQAIETIIRRDPHAVIIVSGDHGPMFLKQRGAKGANWSRDALAERQSRLKPADIHWSFPDRVSS